jgi:phosphate transport system substrate-binding protein
MKRLSIVLAAMLLSSQAYARDTISIVGSSTVFPFATTVAEIFGQGSGFKSPVIESTGSGGGMKMFCKGIGTDTPDITNSSRAIKKTELELCKKRGVTPIERLLGYDGITLSQSNAAETVALTKEEIYKAVVYNVWNGTEFVVNPYKKWSDINPSLPNKDIDIMIPPTTSGTRDAFVELVMHNVCSKVYKLDKKVVKKQCTAVRTDGSYVVQMGENDNLLIEKLQSDEDRFAVFGFSFLDMNRDKVKAVAIDGVKPEFETIADGSYGISRPLFYYIKKEHIGIIPGIEEFDAMFKKLSAADGPLADQGLIPLQ